MSELQNDSVESEVIDNTEVENLEQGAELAPATEGQQEEKPQVDQNAVNEAINRQHKKFRDEERNHLETKQRLEALEKQLGEQQGVKPVVPPMPDSFDDDFDSKVAARDKAIREAAEWEVTQASKVNEQKRQQQLTQQQQLEEVNTKVQSYTKRATELGVDSAELQNAGNTVAAYGISDELTVNILGDPDGPLITKYLAANPLELSDLAQMDTFSAALVIERKIRPAANALKPKISNTPDPATSLQGGGADADAGRYPHIEGATFE